MSKANYSPASLSSQQPLGEADDDLNADREATATEITALAPGSRNGLGAALPEQQQQQQQQQQRSFTAASGNARALLLRNSSAHCIGAAPGSAAAAAAAAAVAIVGSGTKPAVSASDFGDTFEDDSLPCLVLSRLEKIPIKDFSSEVRANLDIERFLREANLLLHVHGADVESIIQQLLQSIFRSESQAEGQPVDEAAEAKVKEAMKVLFVQASWMDQTYKRLSKTLKSLCYLESEGLIADNTWLCSMCSLAGVSKRHVAIARLSSPVNFGRSAEGVSLIVLIVTPTKEKGTKSDIELGRTFATILTDVEFRQRLMLADSDSEFKQLLETKAKDLGDEQRRFRRKSLRTKDFMEQAFNYERSWPVCNGIKADLKRRLPFYPSDFIDSLRDAKSIRKVVSTIAFLYFACLMPCIAFGVLNDIQTDGNITVQRVIVSQCIGGVIFALIGGQPLIVLLTTAPLALYTRVIYEVADSHGLNFFAMFGWVGLFNSLLLVLYSVIDLSKLMRWSTRSTEEIFALFISIAFIVDAFKSINKNFKKNYCTDNSASQQLSQLNETVNDTAAATAAASTVLANFTEAATTAAAAVGHECSRDTSILFLLLCLGTVFLAMYLLNFTKTPFLNRAKRELMADFSLPVAVLVMSVCGTLIFREVKMDRFSCKPQLTFSFVLAEPLPWTAIIGAFGLAIPLSMLFFMDQNISSAMVNCPSHRLQKGSAYHWDLLVVGLINGGLSCFGLPWVHGALPHSPLHVKALADLEERIDLGQHVQQTVVRVRETRLTGIVSNCLIGLSLLLCPMPLNFIPVPVLDGLFICMAISALLDNQLFERVLLLFTEQAAYPPSHYLRRVPQRKVHIFTLLQLLQLAVLCGLGFNGIAYLKMGFPIVLLLQLPIRHLVLPKLINESYLDALDKPM